MTVRPWFAVALVVTATVGPVTSWYFAADEETDRETARVVAGARAVLVQRSARLAAKAGDRLEALRAIESRRPWYHYQPYFHDPGGVAEGISLVPSPLSVGPDDPFVEAHFQFDDSGNVATFGSSVSDLIVRVASEIRERAPPCDRLTARTERMAAPAFLQNAKAGVLVERAREGIAQSVSRGGPDVEVRTTPLEWRTLRSGDHAMLVALRCVETPTDRRVQGLIVDTTAVDAWMREGSPARLVPSPPSMPIGRLALHGADWSVRMADGVELAAAEERAGAIRTRFRRDFALRAGLSLLLAFAAAALVMQHESLARRRADFAAAAAHELRTPLSVIRLHAEMLAHGLADPSRAELHARIVEQEAERLGRVVTNILASTRLERTGSEVAIVRGDLARAAREVVECQRPVLEAAGMAVTFDCDASLPPASFDGDAVVEILCNLLDNAERHSRGAGERCVDVRVGAGRGGRQEIVVTDRGPGVPPAGRRGLFRPFSGASPRGLGLGLSIARGLARAQGGDLTLEPRAGGGTRARLELRVAPADQPE